MFKGLLVSNHISQGIWQNIICGAKKNLTSEINFISNKSLDISWLIIFPDYYEWQYYQPIPNQYKINCANIVCNFIEPYWIVFIFLRRRTNTLPTR